MGSNRSGHRWNPCLNYGHAQYWQEDVQPNNISIKRLRAPDAANPESTLINLNNVFETLNKIIENLKAVTKLQRIYLRSLEPVYDLRLEVELEDPSCLIKFQKQALVDCGATDCFIDEQLIEEKKLPIQLLELPIPIYQSDGEKTSAGDITGYVNLRMRIQQHKESTRFYIMELGKREIFLGYSWLIPKSTGWQNESRWLSVLWANVDWLRGVKTQNGLRAQSHQRGLRWNLWYQYWNRESRFPTTQT